jgi:hypothetical protein
MPGGAGGEHGPLGDDGGRDHRDEPAKRRRTERTWPDAAAPAGPYRPLTSHREEATGPQRGDDRRRAADIDPRSTCNRTPQPGCLRRDVPHAAATNTSSRADTAGCPRSRVGRIVSVATGLRVTCTSPPPPLAVLPDDGAP